MRENGGGTGSAGASPQWILGDHQPETQVTVTSQVTVT